ncbi:MAG: molybdenum cofactor guanylyltransferase [Gemmatimonadales bacterium]
MPPIPTTRPPIRGVILAGGGATRFGGRAKGLESIGGERILDRLATLLQTVTGTAPILVANAPDAPSWRPDLQTIPDVRPAAGALGGLLTAVLAAAPAAALVVAWDMPFVSAGLLQALADQLAEADAALPESAGRRGVEPLCAAYGPGCGGPIAAAIDRGDLRAIAFHSAVRISILPLAEVRRHGDPALLFFNVNTAEDLARAEALWQLGSSRS